MMNDIDKLQLSENDDNNNVFMQFILFLRSTASKIHEYTKYLDEIKTIIDDNFNEIFKRTHYVLNRTDRSVALLSRIYGGGKQKEYSEKISNVYQEYLSKYEDCKFFNINTDRTIKNILKNHENKFENLIIIYNYILNLLKILQEYRYAIRMLEQTCIIMLTYVLLTKYKNNILSVLHDTSGKYTTNDLQQYLEKLQNINQDDELETIAPSMYEDIKTFESFIKDFLEKTKLELNYNLYREITPKLPPQFRKDLDLLIPVKSIIDKHIRTKNISDTDVDTLSNNITNDIITLLETNFSTKYKKIEQLNDIVKRTIRQYIARTQHTQSRESPRQSRESPETSKINNAKSTINTLLRRLH